MADALGDALEAPPSDGITRVRFSHSSDHLLVSSWDNTARLYDGPSGQALGTHTHSSPLLDCCFQDEASIAVAGLDGQLKQVSLETGQQRVLGSHDQAIKCVEWIDSKGVLVTGSWDRTLRLWDGRLPPGQCCVATVQLPGKAYSLGPGPGRLVVATSERHVRVFDLKTLEAGEASQARESSLKYQTRCVGAYPDGRGYALGSVEGRVAMEYFDPDPAAQAAKYAFKCHRRNQGGRDVVYPVNALAFHPTHGTFATGGGDGAVALWDGGNKKRLAHIQGYPAGVASLAYSRDGSLLAVAASYAWERGDVPHPADAVFVRRMADAETRPKPRKTAAAVA